MKNDPHVTSRLLMLSGSLMAISGLLMALCGRLPIGGVFWASASCMFLSAYHFRVAEDKKETERKDDSHDETTV